MPLKSLTQKLRIEAVTVLCSDLDGRLHRILTSPPASLAVLGIVTQGIAGGNNAVRLRRARNPHGNAPHN